jgi:hypothetical protein
VPDDPKLAERYSVKAVALLRRAFEKNYADIAADVQKDKNLDRLRAREDFRKLMKEWTGKEKK